MASKLRLLLACALMTAVAGFAPPVTGGVLRTAEEVETEAETATPAEARRAASCSTARALSRVPQRLTDSLEAAASSRQELRDGASRQTPTLRDLQVRIQV